MCERSEMHHLERLSRIRRDLLNLAPGPTIFSRIPLASILPLVKLCSYVSANRCGKFRRCIRRHLFFTEKLQFLKRLIILVFHLASLSLAVYFRPADTDAVLLQWPEEITDVIRTAAECITVLGVLNYILVQLGGEMINVGPLSFLKQLSHEPAKLIFVISNLLILACIPCRIAGNRHAEDAILVFAVPGSWFLLMFFAGAIRLTGPFVTMVYSMITGDMLTFGIIYTIMLFGFSQSFYFLYKGFPGVKSSLYHSYASTWMALFQITLGDYNVT